MGVCMFGPKIWEDIDINIFICIKINYVNISCKACSYACGCFADHTECQYTDCHNANHGVCNQLLGL